MNIEQQRKAFEEAFKKEHSGVSFWLNTWDEEEQSYGHLTAGWAWKMWLAAQQQEGYVMVPVEPTKAMQQSAFDVYEVCDYKNYHLNSGTEVRDMIYKAMIGAAE